MRELQSSLRDASLLLQSMIDEGKKVMAEEMDVIHNTYSNLYDSIRVHYENVLRNVDRLDMLRYFH